MLVLQVCTHCGSPFTPSSPQKFCSTACRVQFRKEQNQPITLPCGQCGKPITRRVMVLKGRQKSGLPFCDQACGTAYSQAHKTTGTRRSKLEVWLEERLREIYPDLDLHCNRTDAINAELDFYFPSLKLAFELNGIFHYEPIYGPEKLAVVQTNDARKLLACAERGIELCVIDSHHARYFKMEASQRFLQGMQEIVDTAVKDRNLRGWVIQSQNPLRGRTHPPLPPPPPKPMAFKATSALEMAMAWDEEIKDTGVNRRQIAVREGLTGARVTQLMYLLHLPPDVKKGLLARDPRFGNVSVSCVLERAKQCLGLTPQLDILAFPPDDGV